MDDWQLLREFVDKGADGAFEALVGRYVQMVYGVALREVRQHHLAEDVTQAVFGILAQKAGKLREGTVVAGWLFRTTRFAAANALKLQRRRRFHEERAGRLREFAIAEDPREERMRELDGALARLGEKDRGAVLMRYYRRMELAEVGRAMGVSERAARKRVERAVGKMRVWMKGGDAEMAGAMGLMGAKSVSGMAAGALASAKGGAGAGETVSVLMKGALKMMYWAKLKLAAMVFVSVGVVGGAGVVTVQRLAAEGPKETAPVPVSGSDQYAKFDQLVLTRRAELDNFRKANGLLSTQEGLSQEVQLLEKLRAETDEAELREAEAKTGVQSAKLLADKGLGTMAAAEQELNAAQVRYNNLRGMSGTQESRVQALDQAYVQYQRMAAELSALEKARTKLLVKKMMEEDAAKGG